LLEDNPAIAEVSVGQRSLGFGARAGEMPATPRSWAQASAHELMNAIRSGDVNMKVTRLAKEIGQPKFLEVTDLLRQNLGRHPSADQVRQWFDGDDYRNYKSRINYYRSNLRGGDDASSDESLEEAAPDSQDGPEIR